MAVIKDTPYQRASSMRLTWSVRLSVSLQKTFIDWYVNVSWFYWPSFISFLCHLLWPLNICFISVCPFNSLPLQMFDIIFFKIQGKNGRYQLAGIISWGIGCGDRWVPFNHLPRRMFWHCLLRDVLSYFHSNFWWVILG